MCRGVMCRRVAIYLCPRAIARARQAALSLVRVPATQRRGAHQNFAWGARFGPFASTFAFFSTPFESRVFSSTRSKSAHLRAQKLAYSSDFKSSSISIDRLSFLLSDKKDRALSEDGSEPVTSKLTRLKKVRSSETAEGFWLNNLSLEKT